MKLRVGYLKERKPLLDVEDWTVQQLEDAVRREFVLNKDANIGIYFGEKRVNNVKTDKITELGVVSGDLLMVRIASNGEAVPQQNNDEKSKPKKNRLEEKMDICEKPSTSINEMEINNESIVLERVVDLFLDQMHKIGYERYDEYLLSEPHVQTKVFYFKSDATVTRVRCACSLFSLDEPNDSKNINNIQLNATLISKNKMNHQPILNIEKDAKTQILSDFVQNIKESVFGPDNLFLKVMFCGEVELTEKLFNLCGLETVIALRQTCKKIYRKSNSAFLDAHYWKKQFSRMFGQRHLPKKTSKDPNPYRKALFKKLRDQDRAAYFESVLAKARQEAMNFYRPNAEIADPLRVPPPNFPRNNPYGIANFDPVRNFDENFYGQEVFRSRHPNPNMPNAPRIDPHFHDDPRPRRRPDPDMPQGPFGNPNRFI